MRKKILGIILGCMIVVLIGLFFINKPTEVVQTVEVVPTSEPIAEPTVAPYIEPTTTPVVEDEEPAEVKALVEEVTGVSEESIVDVSEKEPTEESIVDIETPAEETETTEATPTPEAVKPTPAVEATPAPEATPTPNTNPNVTTTTTTDKQKELQNAVLQDLLNSGGTMHGEIPNGTGLAHGGNGGTGIKYGDLQ